MRAGTGGLDVIFRPVVLATFLMSAGCAGPVAEVSTIPSEAAAWQAMAPRLPGMPVAAVAQCAGPPRGVAPGPAGGAVVVYRPEAWQDYWQVSLLAQCGRVVSFTADPSA